MISHNWPGPAISELHGLQNWTREKRNTQIEKKKFKNSQHYPRKWDIYITAIKKMAVEKSM